MTVGELLAEAIELRKEIRRLRGIIHRNKKLFNDMRTRARVAEARVVQLENALVQETQKGLLDHLQERFQGF
jgi:hypothetical protein